ncbi:zinc finger CCCH-type with G patch domain-containing protein [Trichogramma pretiosum]|uniref:zinc finger CCCH-type with G patch domain-containing protein n=1 Tax=Trichogramma pretiosum TaxID=7493 RepID=UPI0006C9C039|nr:zinc finger CCCH-type with G patch domain-containing protein [Trichogramma pretiosum]XP_023319154.1 zinc finger CCCH-type with G patch domain-containing protein [Trichogramma pretiosum]XP_023319155.1 zinc finger CCCH-type with G patch domain-containing protein [Trichogramma pretiosum]XP_023319156.1 zinc finger CCCH-type with G patch domain-containing protein [Trichogramma pretiosum]
MDISQYQEQLLQVEQALVNATGQERESLLSLQSDLNEIIQLAYETNDGSDDDISEATNSTNKPNNSLDDEYDLFKAEMAKLDEPSSNDDKNTEPVVKLTKNLEEELKALEGTKCRAPHGSSWGGTGYHNAMICSVHAENSEDSDLSDVMVRILFINPTHKEMLPCPYFLDGSCKFSEEQCHFSHGELISFAKLEEYKEPDFSNLKMGSRILSKQKNNLWHRSVILKCPDNSDELYQLRSEASGTVSEVGIQDILPLDDTGLQMSESSDDSDYEKETYSNINQEPSEELIQKALLTGDTSKQLGAWEQHTRGIGSKLMEKMGYVHGTGLGKNSDGRVQVVEASVLPAGKSLDYCMELKEHAGGDKNLFSVERQMQRQKRKLKQQREKEYSNQVKREKSNVFNFINKTLGDKTDEPSSSKDHKELKKESSKNLRIASYQIEEKLSKLEKESAYFQKSMNQFAANSIQHNSAVARYNETQKKITSLKASAKRISSEQNQRKFKEKFTEF